MGVRVCVWWGGGGGGGGGGAHASQYFTRISLGLASRCACKSDWPAGKFWACAKLFPSKLRVFARRCHRKKRGARKGRSLLVYYPLKESRLAVDLRPSRTSACHLRSYCRLFTDKKKSLYWHLACLRYADMGRSIRGCWGQVTELLLILWRQHSVEFPSTADPQWDIWYWGSNWNLHTVCWSVVGCEWGTTSVNFGITYVCFIPSGLPVFAVEPQYLQYLDFLFLSKVSFEGHIQNLQKISCWSKIWMGFVGPKLIKLWTSSIWGFL